MSIATLPFFTVIFYESLFKTGTAEDVTSSAANNRSDQFCFLRKIYPRITEEWR